MGRCLTCGFLTTLILSIILGYLYHLSFQSYSLFETPERRQYVLNKIREAGGHALVLPNGRIVEYFVVGSTDPTRPVIINVHGYYTTGHFCSFYEEETRDSNVRMVCPSLPGWGYSSPVVGGHPWEDAIPQELLRELNITEFHLMGTSFGFGNAAAFAMRTLLESENKKRILTFTTNVPFCPHMHTFSAYNGSKVAAIFQGPYIGRLFGLLTSTVNMSDMMQQSPAWPSVNLTESKRQKLLKEVMRSTEYQFEGVAGGPHQINNAQYIYDNRAALEYIPKLLVFYGEEDEAAPIYHIDFLKHELLPKHTVYHGKPGGMHLNSVPQWDVLENAIFGEAK
eukprot:PhF_6_TR409/c0_g1_i1/m.122